MFPRLLNSAFAQDLRVAFALLRSFVLLDMEHELDPRIDWGMDHQSAAAHRSPRNFSHSPAPERYRRGTPTGFSRSPRRAGQAGTPPFLCLTASRQRHSSDRAPAMHLPPRVPRRAPGTCRTPAALRHDS